MKIICRLMCDFVWDLINNFDNGANRRITLRARAIKLETQECIWIQFMMCFVV